MKPCPFPRLLTLLAILVLPILRAQSNTGLLEGRVFNAASGTYVESARIAIEGTALETFTDADGRFRLSVVPAGEVRLREIKRVRLCGLLYDGFVNNSKPQGLTLLNRSF